MTHGAEAIAAYPDETTVLIMRDAVRTAFDRGRESAARDEAVVKAEALQEMAELSRGADGYGVENIPTDWLRARAAALLANTTTDANDDETEMR